MLKDFIFLAVFTLSVQTSITAQVGIGTTDPHPSSRLEIESISGGLLPPRMSTNERDAINGGNYAEGLIIYNTDVKCIQFWNGDDWYDLCGSATGSSNGNNLPAGATPAGGVLVNDFFADGNSNITFQLQVRNTTNAPVNWAAILENRPYATIPNLSSGNYTLDTLDNGDGTFTYTFVGTLPLNNFANTTITGGIPSPPGDGDSGAISFFVF